MGHGIGALKAGAFYAVPEVIQKGKVFDRQQNWKGRGYDTAVLAAPISIADKEYICEVIVEQRPNRQGFYLHEVQIKEKLLDVFKTGVVTGTSGASKSVLLDVWQRVKQIEENGSKVVDENGEPLVTYSMASVTANWQSTLQTYLGNAPQPGTSAHTHDMVVCPTPAVMQMVGAKGWDMVVTPGVLDKVMRGKHAVSVAALEQLPAALAEPICIAVSDTPGCLEVVTELKEGADNVLVAVQLNSEHSSLYKVKVNRIASVYGKQKIEALLTHPMLYWDKAKARPWVNNYRLQLPAPILPRRASGRKILKPADLVKYKEEKGLSFAMERARVEREQSRAEGEMDAEEYLESRPDDATGEFSFSIFNERRWVHDVWPTRAMKKIEADWLERLDAYLAEYQAAKANPNMKRLMGQEIYVCPTPGVLSLVGVTSRDVVTTRHALDHDMFTKHGMTRKALRYLPSAIGNPICIAESQSVPGALEILTTLTETVEDSKTKALVKKNVLVALHVGLKSTETPALIVSKIASAYGKNRIKTILDTHKILYWNDQKGKVMLNNYRLQLPQAIQHDLSASNIWDFNDLVKYKQQNKFSFSMERIASKIQSPNGHISRVRLTCEILDASKLGA